MNNKAVNVLKLEDWKKTLYTLWLSQFITVIGMSSCVPFLPLYIRELGVTELGKAQTWSGVIYSAPFFFAVIITPVWGYLGDRYGKKLMVVRALLGLVAVMFLMGFARNIWELFILRVVQGGISGFIAANLALVSASCPKEHSGYAIGFLQTSTSAGSTIGPLIGGILADISGIRNVFFIVTILCFISTVIVITCVHEQKTTVFSQKNSLIHNMRFVWERPVLRRFLWFIALSQSGMVFTTPILAYYLETLHTPPQYLGSITGIMVGCVGLLSTIFAPIWGNKNDKYGHERILRAALPFLCLATLAQAVVPHYGYLFPLRIIIGIFSGALLPTMYTVLSKHAPPEIHGGIMGLASSATLLGNLTAPILCSSIASHVGISWAFLAGGSFIAIVYVGILVTRSTD